jgi:hypothetical protein
MKIARIIVLPGDKVKMVKSNGVVFTDKLT